MVMASILLFSNLSFAAENDSDLPPATPPSSGEVFVRAVLANGSSASNSPLVILARANRSGQIQTTIYKVISDSSGRALLSLDAGSYEFDALLINPSTSGADYASTATAVLPQSQSITLIFYPSGSLSGKATLDGSPVPNAKVWVSCPSATFDYERINGGTQVQAGEAGDFLFRVLPTGSCQVSSSADSLAGSAAVTIQHGKSASATIELKKKSSGTDILPTALAALAIAGAIYLLAFRKPKKEGGQSQLIGIKKEQQPPPTPSSKPDPQPEQSRFNLSDPKVKAVLSTLSDREAEIVKFLFKQNGRAKRSQIQHKLLIPKTSLLRNLRSLERKNIVKLTPFGRNLLAEVEEKLFL
ncbi:MAG: hypothetical protein QW568_02945 [Candidatus Anstonellaceae archaeon]